MPPPEQGYGPVNYARQGEASPFGSADNRVRYVDMVRQQIVSQYQQNIVQPATLTLSQQRMVATQPRFQYGVQGGQQGMAQLYARQSTLNRMAYSHAVAGAATGMGAWGLGAAGVAAAGIAPLSLAGLALPFVAAAPVMHFVNKGLQNNLERQRYMHGIAADVEQYRDRLGFSTPLTTSRATQLGRGLAESMGRPGQFFTREQQSQIHKIGLANELVSARGQGIDTGTIKQYQRNVEELISTTEDIVKLLQTTKEGGLSVIKELKQTGFGNIGQIRQQVIQAKAFGTMTGLGAQNVMQIGAAGARAAQGTPWTAAAMAQQFQGGAAQAAFMTQRGGRGAAAVQRAGGVAAAGAQIAGFQANVLMSGIGTKMMAYAMNADGSMDDQRMGRLLEGGIGAYEVVAGANQRGYAMGPSGRALFERNRARNLNAMSPEGRSRATMRAFELWGQQGGRGYADLEARAWKFSEMYTNNFREQELMTEDLLAPKNFVQRAAERRAVSEGLATVQRPNVPTFLPGLMEPMRDIGRGLERFGATTGDYVTGAAEMVSGGVGAARRAVGGMAMRGLERAFAGPYGWRRGQVGDPTTAARRRMGLGLTTTQRTRREYGRLTAEQIQGAGRIREVDLGLDYGQVVQNTDRQSLAFLTQTLQTAAFNNTLTEAFKDHAVLNALDITAGSSVHKRILENTTGSYQDIQRGLNPRMQSMTKKGEEAMTRWENRFKDAGESRAQGLDQLSAGMKMMTWEELAPYRIKTKQYEMAVAAGKPTKAYSRDDMDEIRTYQAIIGRREAEKVRGLSMQGLTTDIAAAERAGDIAARRAMGMETAGEQFGFGVRAVAEEAVARGEGAGVINVATAAVAGLWGAGRAQWRRFRRGRALKAAGIEAGDESDMVAQLRDKLRNFETINKKDNEKGKALLGAAAAVGWYDPSVGTGEEKIRMVQRADTAYKNTRQGEIAEEKAFRARGGRTFFQFLERGVGAEIGVGVRGEMERIFRGGVDKPKAISDIAVEKFATGLNMTQEGVRDLFTKGELVDAALGRVKQRQRGVTDMMEDRSLLRQNLTMLNRAITGQVTEVVKLKTGGDKEEPVAPAEFEKTANALERQLTMLTMSELGKPATQVAMQPPTLNYWNNRWTL